MSTDAVADQRISSADATVIYGDAMASIYRRDWIAGPRVPYRKTYQLKPGERWTDAAVTGAQSEHYVQLADGYVPVGAMIARELVANGAQKAFFTELWTRVVLVGQDLVCAQPAGDVLEFLKTMRHALGRSLGGLPDVIGFYADGRIALREAKNVLAKDKLRSNQHRFVRVARERYGARIDAAIVEWGFSRGG